MPVFSGELGIPDLTLVDKPYIKPPQTFLITIRNYQGRAGAGTTRVSEVSFYGNEPSQCSDVDKVCNPNRKILGLKLAVDETFNTSIYLVLGDYFGYTKEQNILLETMSIPVGSNLKFTVQIGNGKIVVKRGDTMMISTSYSQPDPIVNEVYYRVAQADNAGWSNAMIGVISENVGKELWNIEYQTLGFGFEFMRMLNSLLPLVFLVSVIPLIFARRKAKT